MSKLVLGKTPEDLEKERAAQQAQLEQEVQEAILERQAKITALHKKQKSNLIIVSTVSALVIGILLIYGTYNTFFKKGITIDDVNTAIGQARYTDVFPEAGLDNYIRDNCDALFDKYMSIDMKKSGKDIASVELDPNSCYIFKVRKISPTLAQVYFAVDVVTTEKDSVVTDNTVLEQLKRSGFSVDMNTSVEVEGTTEEIIEEPTETEVVDEVITEENEDELVEIVDENNDTDETTDETIVEDETVSDDTVEPIVDEPVDDTIPTTDIEYKVNQNSESVHYYMSNNGQVMQSGKVSRERYYFYIPIELVYTYDTDGVTPVTSGFAPAGEMNLYSLNETDQTTFDEINTNSLFAFDDNNILDEDTTAKMQVKVNNTLRGLYEGTDTSQDFLNFRTFNNYNSSFVGIDKFEAYSVPNQMGYNVYVEYTITTAQGFNYKLATYMKVEQNGGTWVIKGIL